MDEHLLRAVRSTELRPQDIDDPNHPRNVRIQRVIAWTLIVILALCFIGLASAETLAIVCTDPTATTAQNCGGWKYDMPLSADRVQAGTSWIDFALKPISALAASDTLQVCTTDAVLRGSLSSVPFNSSTDPCKSWSIVRADLFASAPSIPLAWTQDLKRADGSVLTNLAGFRIVYGTNAADLTQIVQLPDPIARSYVLSNLVFGTNYFIAVKSFDTDNVESGKSNTVQRTTPTKPTAPKAKPLSPLLK